MTLDNERGSDRLTVHPEQTVHQLADLDVQGVVTYIQLVDGLVHAGQPGHWTEKDTMEQEGHWDMQHCTHVLLQREL